MIRGEATGGGAQPEPGPSAHCIQVSVVLAVVVVLGADAGVRRRA